VFHPVWLTTFESGEEEYPLRWYGLAAICLALFVGQIDVTIANVALPSISRALHATTADLQWVMDAYSVVLAGFVLLGGGLADRYGRKGTFIAGMALFGAASFGAAFATEPWHLIAARGIMGFGSALFFPPALSILAVIFVEAERGRAVSIWASAGGIATVLGPVVGGLLLGSLWWGSVFLVNVPFTIIAIVGAALLLPTSTRPGAPPLDLGGAFFSVVGLTGLVYGLIEGPNRGWSSPLILGSLALGLVGVAVFVLWETKVEDPMVDLSVFRLGGVSGGGLAITMNLLAMAALLFLLPQYLQYVAGESTVTVGLSLVPFGLTFMVLAFASGRLARGLGVRLVLVGGLVVMAAGTVVLAFAPDLDTIVAVLIGTMIFGAGAGLVAPPATTAVMNALPTAKAGDGSAVNQVTRQIGAAFGVALAGSILAVTYTNELSSSLAGLSSGHAAVADASLAGAEQVAAATSSSTLLDAARDAFSSGYTRGLLVPAALTLLTAVFVAVVVRPTTDTDG